MMVKRHVLTTRLYSQLYLSDIVHTTAHLLRLYGYTTLIFFATSILIYFFILIVIGCMFGQTGSHHIM